MRISSLLYLIVFLSSFGFYFYYIEDLLVEMWQKFLAFMILLSLLQFSKSKAELHFEFLNKRMNKELSVWIVIGIFSGIMIFGMLLSYEGL